MSSIILKKIRDNFNSFSEVLLFFKIIILILLLPIFFKLFSLQKIIKLFTPTDSDVSKRANTKITKDKLVKFTDYILNKNIKTRDNSCLKRSLILYHFLRKMGINVSICFGVKYNEHSNEKDKKNMLTGHAWLTYNGKIFLERNEQLTKTYKTTYSFPKV